MKSRERHQEESRRRGGSGAGMIAGVLGAIGLVVLGAWWWTRGSNADTEFARLMSSGRTFYEKSDPHRAASAFQSALAMNPSNPDAHLNLANAFLAANQPAQVLIHAAEVIQAEPGSAAAHYLRGCAYNRLNEYSNAVQSLQEAKSIDPTVNAASYQLARAQSGLGHWPDAEKNLREILEFETNRLSPLFLSSHYQLSQVLLRQGRTEDAQPLLAEYQKLMAGRQVAADDPSIYERCVYTEIRAPFALEQPLGSNPAIRFVDATAVVVPGTGGWRGPLAWIDVGRRGANDLLAFGGDGRLQLLRNEGGVLTPGGTPMPTTNGGAYAAVLVGDLNTDPSGGRQEDVLVVGEAGSHAYRFSTNGSYIDATGFSGLRGAAGVGGVLADLDFTGKLGVLVAGADARLRTFRSLGNLVFRENTATSSLPTSVTGIRQVVVDDWNNDDLPDVILVRQEAPPLLSVNQRGGAGFAAPVTPAEWPVATAVVLGDLNNDLRADAVFLTADSLTVLWGGIKEPSRMPAKRHALRAVGLLDYDNDGWLDILAWGGDGVRLWRNRGRQGFAEVSEAVGLGKAAGDVRGLIAADVDMDGDTDLAADVSGQGLRLFRNEGGDASRQLKLRLFGNRSNPSGLGVKVELTGSGWRALRTVRQLPVEIGVGKRDKLDSVSVRWFDTRFDTTEVEVTPKVALDVFELVNPSGSCPYVYVWDGTRYRFVTDILGASPLGLPLAEGRRISADPEEYVRLGDEATVVARDGRITVQVTEELREVLYLDHAELVVADVDAAAGLELHPTSKLVPGPPFPGHGLVAVGRERPLRGAWTAGGVDVRDALRRADGRRVSPPALRGPQLRGLAAPLEIILDFGPLPSDKPLSLVLEGWLRFGGGMANIAGSQDQALPFPFPRLQVEMADGAWQPVDVVVGAPAGKTKSIVVDLKGRLPEGAGRLKLTQAFEIHWDRVALFEAREAVLEIARLMPATADLHWRGYSEFAGLQDLDLLKAGGVIDGDRVPSGDAHPDGSLHPPGTFPAPWDAPLVPVYSRVRPSPPWRITPSGWVTRYGPVDELIGRRDDGLALVAGGDELTLEFEVGGLAPVAAGHRRVYFLHVVGWDKDADFHVAEGWRVEPLPWAGMDDQRYGQEIRPKRSSDILHERLNTRWVGPVTYARRGEARRHVP